MDEHFDAMPKVVDELNRDYGLDLRLTCAACPVQISGEVGD